MGKGSKRSGEPSEAASKKTKNVSFNEKVDVSIIENQKKPKTPKVDKSEKPQKFSKKAKPINKNGTFKKNAGDSKSDKPQEKTNWNEFKKEKKQLKLKRKQRKIKNLYEVAIQAKALAEKIRSNPDKTKVEDRDRLVGKLHEMCGGQGNYPKFVLSHDMSRVVQLLLKFGNEKIRKEISNELIPATVELLQSKYGRNCVKRMLKYGATDTRKSIMNATYGKAVKLASHAISAPIFEYGYTTFATPLQKQHLVQEFYGDMYRQSKDDSVAHIRDVYRESPDLKTATLKATKINLSRILNKDLLDSGLVQSVLCQFFSECGEEDRNELVSQLAKHVAVLCNSKDGARVAMQCIWKGSTKDRKITMKALKEHILNLSKHEHGHTVIIALLDATDDTVLLNKVILSQILPNAQDLAGDEWGRKVLLWLVSPANTAHFHPSFIKEIKTGREASTSKKAADVREAEILAHTSKALLPHISENPKFWLSTSSLAVLTVTALKCAPGDLGKVFERIAEVIVDPSWKVKDECTEINGIEHAGLHMVLKKLVQNDKVLVARGEETTFSQAVTKAVLGKDMRMWIQTNRGCFLFVLMCENGSEMTRMQLKTKLKEYKKLLQEQSSAGAKLLLKHVNS